MFARACDLEAQLIAKREALGQNEARLTSFGKGRMLADAVATPDLLPGLDDDPHCDNGWCMT